MRVDDNSLIMNYMDMITSDEIDETDEIHDTKWRYTYRVGEIPENTYTLYVLYCKGLG